MKLYQTADGREVSLGHCQDRGKYAVIRIDGKKLTIWSRHAKQSAAIKELDNVKGRGWLTPHPKWEHAELVGESPDIGKLEVVRQGSSWLAITLNDDNEVISSIKPSHESARRWILVNRTTKRAISSIADAIRAHNAAQLKKVAGIP